MKCTYSSPAIRRCSKPEQSAREQRNELQGNRWTMKATLFFLGSCLLFALPVFAQDSLRFVSATTGAGCYEVEYNNNYLYVGAGTTLRVYDVHPGNLPPFPMVFEYRYRSLVTDLKIKNDILYVAANHDGISKWNIANPSNPEKIADYVPTDLKEAAYDISLSGDSLLVAFNSKIILFQDQGNSLAKLKEFGSPQGNGHIVGGDVKDTLFAFVQQRGTTGDGVHIYNLKTLTQISYFAQTFCDPEDVVFGKNNNLLHVLAGTASLANPLDARGLFYTLDLTNPNSPARVFADTVPGFVGLAIAAPMSAININDTIYVATEAGLDPDWVFPNPAYGQVFVYDATNPLGVKRIKLLNAGLWHFDVSAGGQRLFIASEWYGVKTLDISDLDKYRDLGNTLTGGWNMGADKRGKYLALADEGYGIKKYDISTITQPVLASVKNDSGFCYQVKFSPDGNYLYALFVTYAGFRIYDANSLALVGSISSGMANGSTHDTKMFIWNNRIYINMVQGVQSYLKIVDVSNPASPTINASIALDINDMFMDETGILYIANNNELAVYDITNNNLQFLAADTMGSLNDAKKVAVYQDTVFAFISNHGIVRYRLDNHQLVETGTASLPNGSPDYLAADSQDLYALWTKYGCYAYDKQTLKQIGYYRTGLDYRDMPNNWPVEDLFCKDGYIFVVEYFGQTTILTMAKSPAAVTESKVENPFEMNINPNPVRRSATVRFLIPKAGDVTVKVYDIQGSEKATLVNRNFAAGEHSVVFDSRDLTNGVYFYRIVFGNDMTITKKIIVVR